MYTLEGISSVAHFTIVQIMFHFLWDHWAHCGIFENGVLLMYTLEGISSVAYFTIMQIMFHFLWNN